MNLLTKQTHRLREQTYSWGAGGGGRDTWAIWDGHVYTAILKMDDQPGPSI